VQEPSVGFSVDEAPVEAVLGNDPGAIDDGASVEVVEIRNILSGNSIYRVVGDGVPKKYRIYKAVEFHVDEPRVEVPENCFEVKGKYNRVKRGVENQKTTVAGIDKGIKKRSQALFKSLIFVFLEQEGLRGQADLECPEQQLLKHEGNDDLFAFLVLAVLVDIDAQDGLLMLYQLIKTDLLLEIFLQGMKVI